MTTATANEFARDALLKIIVEQLQRSARARGRRSGEGLSPRAIWREIHRHGRR